MSSLYELTEEYQTLIDMLEDPDVDEQTLADTLEGIKGELEAKAEGYIAVRNEIKAKSQVFKQEEQTWKAKREREENALKRLDKALFDSMVACGFDDKNGLDTGKHKLKIVNNGGVLPVIIDIKPEELPPVFQKVKIEPDNEAIRGMLEKDEEVRKQYPWAHLGERGRHLSIR